MNTLIDQKPATKNQIKNTKPDVIKHSNYIDGFIANSVNGGILKTIAYKPVMAGEKISEYRIRMNIKMLTPLTPAYQRLTATLMTFNVPNSRVWDNWEKFLSQKGGASETKITEIPNIGGKTFPEVSFNNGEFRRYYSDTIQFRDSWISSYIPRWQTGVDINADTRISLPKYSVLPMRGFKAIYNDFLRNKEYDPELEEFKSDNVSNAEWDTFIEQGSTGHDFSKTILRGKRQNSYYTNYRTELLGENLIEPDGSQSDALVSITEWEKKVSELRSESEFSQLNDWDVISKIRGSKPLTEGKVVLLGRKTIPLNISAITQSTYNVNQNISEEFQAMGTQGAYSYTEIDVPMFQFQDFNEDGYIHTIIQISADSVFETGFERTGLNVGKFDIYRPDLKELKNDVIYDVEKRGTNLTGDDNLLGITGYKRKFSEYFKLPNVIAGDMTTENYHEAGEYQAVEYESTDNNGTETQKTFQYFEKDDRFTTANYKKNIWQDYTDLLINKNQAVQNEIETYHSPEYSQDILRIKGQNQIFFVGTHSALTSLPIDEKIKENFTEWGEK